MKSENCPEIRCEIAEKSRQANRSNEVDVVEHKKEKSKPKLFTACGRPYCLNLAKLEFTFHDESDRYELDLHVYKCAVEFLTNIFISNWTIKFPRRFLDTSLIEVDAQPNYIRVTVKGKVFQMALNDEIRVDASTSQRSQITGHLLIVMPKLNGENCVTMKVEATAMVKSKLQSTKPLKETVNIRNIVVDESEVPPLIWKAFFVLCELQNLIKIEV